MNVPHTIKKDTVSLRRKDFEALLERMEEMEDIIAFDRAQAADDEGFPMDVAKRLVAGESAVRVFRDYRGLTQEALAGKAGITKSMISKIEAGAKKGSLETIRAIAKALKVEVGDLV